MEHIFPYLYPKPGWTNGDISEGNETTPYIHRGIIGKHCILEIYGCDQNKLNDEAFIRTTITSSAKLSGATLINLITHRFSPKGVTGLALLAESHISIHTWPEIGYGAVDVFTCGDKTMPEKACEVFIREFSAQSHYLKSINRATPNELRNSIRKPNFE